MKFISLDKKSIKFKLTIFIIVIIISQTTLLMGMLIVGGVLSQAKKNAYDSFYEKVNNRNVYVQREMNNLWSNLEPYTSQINDLLSESKNNDLFFSKATKDLISILRTTRTTGAFIVLNDETYLGEHSALYFRDYDPSLAEYSNKDLYLVRGPAEVARDNNIPLDEEWKYTIKLNEGNEDFYTKPFLNSNLSKDSKLLGYWSTPFKMFPNDMDIITYSMPIYDSKHNFKGIIGIELSLSYLSEFLPATDLQPKDSLGYLIGYKGKNDSGIKPILMTRAIQNRVINSNENLALTPIDPGKNINLIKNDNSEENIYAVVEKINLYNVNTPFEDEQWFLVGIMPNSSLLSYVIKIKWIIFISLPLSILVGTIYAFVISNKFTRPIITLAKQVRESHKDKVISLNSTGLSEIDELSKAMEYANNALLDSTLKMSQIIDLVEVPIGAFEYKDEIENVFVTEQLMEILSIERDTMNKLINNKSLFIEHLNNILSHPEEDEESVFLLEGNQKKYVKIKTVVNHNSTLGVVIDVTNDIVEKNKIKQDRDYDPLTKLLNRKAAQSQIEAIIFSGKEIGTTAILMFDLDNLKVINDTYGHKWGDIYIKAAVKQLNKIGKENKILGRRSGDEFVLLLYGYSSKASLKSAIDEFYDNLQKELLTLPDGQKKAVTISAGLFWVTNSDLSYDELLQYSDEALYKAKRFHKGTCCESDFTYSSNNQ